MMDQRRDVLTTDAYIRTCHVYLNASMSLVNKSFGHTQDSLRKQKHILVKGSMGDMTENDTTKKKKTPGINVRTFLLTLESKMDQTFKQYLPSVQVPV